LNGVRSQKSTIVNQQSKIDITAVRLNFRNLIYYKLRSANVQLIRKIKKQSP